MLKFTVLSISCIMLTGLAAQATESQSNQTQLTLSGQKAIGVMNALLSSSDQEVVKDFIRQNRKIGGFEILKGANGSMIYAFRPERTTPMRPAGARLLIRAVENCPSDRGDLPADAFPTCFTTYEATMEVNNRQTS